MSERSVLDVGTTGLGVRWRIDLLLVVAVAVIVGGPTVLGWPPGGVPDTGPLTYALLGVSVASLTLRRRFPLGVTIVTAAAFTLLHLRVDARDLATVPTMVALYTVAAQGTRARTTLVAAAAAVWALAIGLLGSSSSTSPGEYSWFDMVLWPSSHWPQASSNGPVANWPPTRAGNAN